MGRVTTTPPGNDNPPESPAFAALADLGRDAPRPHTSGELDQGWRALHARVGAGRSRRRALLMGALVGATAAVLIVSGTRLAPMLRNRSSGGPTPVAVAGIEGGSLLGGGYLSESGQAGIKLHFNEGTEFDLTPGTRGRLREVAKDGAHLAIEDGAGTFEVTQDPARHWTVEAGPFLVTVKGTMFDVSWDSKSERFEVALRRGRVAVSGPVIGGGLQLRAGQRLVVRLPRAETVITEDGAVGAAPSAEPNELPPPVARPAVPATMPARHEARIPGASSVAATPAGTRTGEERRWSALLAAGRWDRILAEADRDGVQPTLEGASREDLFALADAARYRRRIDLARAALLAEQRRFPTGSRALDAIFLLGRVEELRDDGAARAMARYDEYLARAPTGPYAAEALGRKMILANAQGGAAKARPIADEYLRRFPDGSYAGSARALSRGP